MTSLRKLLLNKLVARAPTRAFRLSAEKLGVSQVTIRLEEESPLFRPDGGETLELPLDDVIAPWILDHGSWQLEELDFIVEHAPRGPFVLFDIGANIGLVTRQLMHRLPHIAFAVCYEPHPGHFQVLSRNLAHLKNCCLVQVAIGPHAGELQFYEDVHNSGNYSLTVEAMEGNTYRKRTVRCMPARDDELLGRLPTDAADLPIVWKSDTQGFDEAIVTSLSKEFWKRVSVAAMEISRINKPEFVDSTLAEILELFPVRRFGGEPELLSVSDVMQFARGSGGPHKDLLLAKN